MPGAQPGPLRTILAAENLRAPDEVATRRLHDDLVVLTLHDLDVLPAAFLRRARGVRRDTGPHVHEIRLALRHPQDVGPFGAVVVDDPEIVRKRPAYVEDRRAHLDAIQPARRQVLRDRLPPREPPAGVLCEDGGNQERKDQQKDR